MREVASRGFWVTTYGYRKVYVPAWAASWPRLGLNPPADVVVRRSPPGQEHPRHQMGVPPPRGLVVGSSLLRWA